MKDFENDNINEENEGVFTTDDAVSADNDTNEEKTDLFGEYDDIPPAEESEEKHAEPTRHDFKLYENINLPDEDEMPNIDDDKIIRGDGIIEGENWGDFDEIEKNKPTEKGFARSLFDILEMFAAVTVVIILCFTFIVRLNKVDGPSMEQTLHTGEFLAVSDLFYTPTRGDIVVVHKMNSGALYSEPIVKRVIAIGGDVVDIDFNTWTLTVNGEVVDESDYVYLGYNSPYGYTSEIAFPVTVEEGKVFVMGDNRNNSADSRVASIGQIDERCIIGKVYARLFPLNTFTIFSNPYND